MAETADFEQMLETWRSLSQAQQEAVLNFARSLQATTTKQPLNISLQQIAKLSVAQRHKILAAYIPDTAQDFLTDSELTEFSIIDTQDWEG